MHPPASGCKKTYEETLLDVYEYSKAVGLPYRHVQIDSWWCKCSRQRLLRFWFLTRALSA